MALILMYSVFQHIMHGSEKYQAYLDGWYLYVVEWFMLNLNLKIN